MDWDWEQFYRNADYDRCVYLAGEEMADLLARFFEREARGGGDTFPEDVASVGCGPAVTLFDLAERFPRTEFYGYDVSETVIEDNQKKATDQPNLHFEVDALPSLDIDRTFDVVYCVATLFFVADPEEALESLFDRVRDGGSLVVNYPNDELRKAADSFEGRKREAFELVRNGQNVLTETDVSRGIGTEVRDYWKAVDAEELAKDQWPTVYAKK
ncbi:methyltransferase [Halorussus halophilus]|uniref:methyltransferase n=1 Tax=Halorussus halophilus TaxID=2650975 RepID=UPI0013016333|nr:methyltransferase [Halorussus halophilus]